MSDQRVGVTSEPRSVPRPNSELKRSGVQALGPGPFRFDRRTGPSRLNQSVRVPVYCVCASHGCKFARVSAARMRMREQHDLTRRNRPCARPAGERVFQRRRGSQSRGESVRFGCAAGSGRGRSPHMRRRVRPSAHMHVCVSNPRRPVKGSPAPLGTPRPPDPCGHTLPSKAGRTALLFMACANLLS